jgi:hypothetical protein
MNSKNIVFINSFMNEIFGKAEMKQNFKNINNNSIE